MTIAAVLFDLDGTLADTAHDLGGALNRLLVEENRPPIAIDLLRPHVSGGARALLGRGFGLTPTDAGYDTLLTRFLAHYEAATCVETVLFDGMREVLDALDARAIAWGIVTNKSLHFATAVAAGLGLQSHLACLVGGDSTPHPKPAPDPLQLACRLIGSAPAQTLYVGDDLRDIQAGKAAGTGTVAAAWGYLGDGLPVSEWQADAIVDAPAELLSLL